MSLKPVYEIPDPEEEAAIFGVPGPAWLTNSPDTSIAVNEAGFMEAAGYDEHQERADEMVANYAEELFSVLSLTAEQRAAVEAFIKDLLGGKG